MNSNFFINLWKSSFTYKLILTIRKKLVEGLEGSFIISTFLRDENIYGKAGFLVKLTEKTNGLLTKLFKKTRHILYGPISASVLLNLAISTGRIILSDIYSFCLTTLGTSLLVFGTLSLFKGTYPMIRMLFFIIIGSLFIILGHLNIQLDRIFKDSKFLIAIKKILDYNS